MHNASQHNFVTDVCLAKLPRSQLLKMILAS